MSHEKEVRAATGDAALEPLPFPRGAVDAVLVLSLCGAVAGPPRGMLLENCPRRYPLLVTTI